MLLTTRVAARYEMREKLGEGGMGVVYRAFDSKTRSEVALKAMRDISDPAAVELFTREWSVLAGMSHPNIVDVRDVGEIDDNGKRTPFFVMPLLNGFTLAKLIEVSDPRLSPAFIVELMLQVCRGLQAAHERGLVHRDLKPSNIFVLEDDTAKIIDFGVVHLADAHSLTGHKGTWQYMAPEVTELHPATPASDIFSLGVICYEAITGRRPFARRTAIETVEAVRKFTPPPVCDVHPSASPALGMAVHKAMAKQAVHRFASAREFAETLRRAQLGQPIERFDPSRIQPRIVRARNAFLAGDYAFSREILSELQSEGHIDPEIGALSAQVDEALKQGKIRQLLRDARARLEQDELTLATEKLREVLDLDPENADARWLTSEAEQQSAVRQVENWLAAARRHLDRCDFIQARQTIRSALGARPGDARITELLHTIEETERASVRRHAEREQLYDSAVRTYHMGEMNAALEKMDRLLALAEAEPGRAAERVGVYRNFHERLRAERETITNAQGEARRLLAARDFTKALELCDRLLVQFPGNPLFQSLRLEAAESQRREMAAYMAEIHGRMEGEDDLDGKVEILQEAANRCPEEPQFQEWLKLLRDRRNLVHSIAAKARQYEEQNHFDLALSQWELLRGVCPRYPGLAFEMEHAARQRERQDREDARLQLVQKVDRALESRTFEEAHDLALAALADYPHDTELVRLARLAEEGASSALEVRRLLGEAQAAGDAGRLDDCHSLLERAMELDDRHPAVRAALAGAFIEQARRLVDEDWRQAEVLIEKAAAVDGAHTALKQMRLILADARRKEEVARCLSEARELQRAGNLEAPLAKAPDASASYPNDRQLAPHGAPAKSLAEGEKRIEEGRQPSGPRDATLFSRTQYGFEVPLPPPAETAPPAVVREVAPRQRSKGITLGLRRWAARTREKGQALGNGLADLRRKAAATLKQTSSFVHWQVPARIRTLPSVRYPARRVWIPAVVVLSIGLLIVAREINRPAKPPATSSATPQTRVVITTSPLDASVTIDGRLEERRQIDLATGGKHLVTVSKPGYVPIRVEESPRSQWNFTLAAEPLRLSIFTAEPAGTVFLDGKQAGELTQGVLVDLAVPADGASHKMAVRTAAGDLFGAAFIASAGTRAMLDPIDAKGLIAVSSLWNDATVYSGTPDRRLVFGGEPAQTIPAVGLSLALTAQNRQFQLMTRGNPEFSVESANGPVLSFWLTGSRTALPYAIVGVDAPDAHLYLDGREIKRLKNGYWRVQQPPGTYALKIAADGFFDYEETLNFKEGDVLNLHPELKPKPVLSTLSIAKGTPGAEVWLGGKSIGRVDDSGAFSAADLAPGEWAVELREAGYEPKQLKVHLTAGQNASLSNDEASLTPFGKIEFQISPLNAKVQCRDGDTVADGRTSGTVAVPARRYRVTASADGYENGAAEVNVKPGETAKVALVLHAIPAAAPAAPKPDAPTPANLFLDGPRLRREDDGWSLTGPGIAWLVPGIRRLVVSIIKPDRGRLDLRIDADSKNGVAYEFDGRRLRRTSTLAGKHTSMNLLKPAKGMAQLTASVLIESRRIVLSGADGAVIEELHSDNADFSAGKVGIMGDAHFIIRSY
ncbi:MAG TPA: protein kinase [Bryobacteraceae bacterium]|nr:protein kinase [Bryobacteraceae bacterium]